MMARVLNQDLLSHANNENYPVWRRYGPKLLFISAALCLMYALHRINYLLFHSFVETFSIVVATGIFIIAWHVRRLMTGAYFAILGCGYLCVAVLDFVHMLTYPGMDIFSEIAYDSAIQVWVATRLVESLSLLAAPLLLHRTCKFRFLVPLYAAVCLAILAAIFIWPIFPSCHIPGQGLTAFKKNSEYLIVAILGAAIFLLHRKGQALDADVRRLMVVAIVLTIVSEVTFTLYKEPQGIYNVIGHFFKFVSFYLIYQAMVETGLIRPYALMAGDLHRKEVSLLHSQSAFEATINACNDFIVLADSELRYVAVNRAAAEILKQAPRDLTGRTVEKTLPIENYPRLQRRMEKVLENGLSTRFEGRLCKATYSITIHPIFDERSEVAQLAVIFRDITQSKILQQDLIHSRDEMEKRVADRTLALSQANEQLEREVTVRSAVVSVLKKKNLLLRSLVRAMPDMVVFKDSRGRYLIANLSFQAFFGLENETVIGHTDKDLEPADTGQFSDSWDQQVIAKGRMLRFEARLCSAAGLESHWDIRKVPVKDEDGGLMGVLSLARDITAFKQREAQLRQSEALLQTLLDGISEPMLMLDENLQPIFINKSAGESSPSEGADTPDGRCHPLLCNNEPNCEDCIIAKRAAENRFHRFERRPGSDPERIERIELIPSSINKDGMKGTIVRITDLTEAKKIERHLVHSEKMSALGMLVSGIVHEINNPNSFITFNLPILSAYMEKIFTVLDTQEMAVADQDWFGMDYQGFRSEMISLLENLSHGSARIDKIVSNLKAITHPRLVSKARLRADLNDVIDKAVTLCRNKVRKHVRVFDVGSLKDTVWLHADPEGLEQVLINLLINAAQAADKRDSWIRLIPRIPENGNQLAAIEISDNGCGIDPANLGRIFDPFFTTKGPGVGTGLGLSMSYNMIRQMGGTIDVKSTPQKETTFLIHLPVADVMGLDQGEGDYNFQTVS